MVSDVVQAIIDGLVVFATDLLIPFMAILFLFAIAARTLIFYTIKREEMFARQFEARVDDFVAEAGKDDKMSFYIETKRLLEKTFYEIFEVQSYLKMKQPDFIMTVGDRLFLIKQGCAWFVHDILKQIKHLRFNDQAAPKIHQISKNTFSRNPCFNKVLGVFPTGTLNDLVNILPAVVIVMGIFGTFLGIMKALPDLSEMDLKDINGTKMVMDQFLLKISFSMSTSLLGILISVVMSFLNTVMSPSKIFIESVDRLESSLDTIWNLSSSNDLPSDIPDFDEHRDPLEALAEQYHERQLAYSKFGPKGESRSSKDEKRRAS
jgi:hypothetical protein